MKIEDARQSSKAFLPDAISYNPSPAYITALLEQAHLSQRQADSLLGHSERAMRNFLTGKSRISYTAQFCLEVLARSGIDVPPRETGVWFNTRQRPLRETDAGRLIVARVAGDLRFGRVAVDGFGVGIDAVPGMSVGASRIGANAITDYAMIDSPPAT